MLERSLICSELVKPFRQAGRAEALWSKPLRGLRFAIKLLVALRRILQLTLLYRHLAGQALQHFADQIQ